MRQKGVREGPKHCTKESGHFIPPASVFGVQRVSSGQRVALTLDRYARTIRHEPSPSQRQTGATEEAPLAVRGAPMIFISVKFSIRPDVVDQWLARVAPFTAATRAEPGNLFFEWSHSVDSPNQFVLLEAFRDHAAGEAHVHSEHFKVAMAWMPDVVAATPEIIHVDVPGDGWATIAELQPRTAP